MKEASLYVDVLHLLASGGTILSLQVGCLSNTAHSTLTVHLYTGSANETCMPIHSDTTATHLDSYTTFVVSSASCYTVVPS